MLYKFPFLLLLEPPPPQKKKPQNIHILLQLWKTDFSLYNLTLTPATILLLSHAPNRAVQDHHWSSVCEVPWPQTPACKWKKKPPQPPIPTLQLLHRLEKPHLPQHSQGPGTNCPPDAVLSPHPWHLQVEGVVPLPINSKTLLFFPSSFFSSSFCLY